MYLLTKDGSGLHLLPSPNGVRNMNYLIATLLGMFDAVVVLHDLLFIVKNIH